MIDLPDGEQTIQGAFQVVIIEASCAHFVHLLQPSYHDGLPQVTAWLCIIQVTYCGRHGIDAYDPTGERISCHSIRRFLSWCAPVAL